MTNKSLVYMLVAVMVGYTLVSAVPDQIAMYTTPQPMMSLSGDTIEMAEGGVPEPKTDEGGRLFEDIPVGGIEDPEKTGEDSITEAVAITADSANQSAAEAAEAARRTASGLNTFSMVSSWIIDVMIAVGVYFLAKRRFG